MLSASTMCMGQRGRTKISRLWLSPMNLRPCKALTPVSLNLRLIHPVADMCMIVDSHRVEKGWNKLDRFTIDVISFTESKIELVSDNEDSDKAKENLLKKMEDKMSSTYIRGWIVKNQGTGN